MDNLSSPPGYGRRSARVKMQSNDANRIVILDAIESQFGAQKFDRLVDSLDETVQRKRFRFWQIDLFDELQEKTGHSIKTVADYHELFVGVECRSEHRTRHLTREVYPHYENGAPKAIGTEALKQLDELDSAVSYDETQSFWGIEFGDPIILAAAADLILGGGQRDRLEGGFNLLYEGSAEGPWATTIPIPVIDAFSDLRDSQISEVASEWRKLEEFHGNVNVDTSAKNLRWLRSAFQGFKSINIVPCLWMSL